MSVLAVLLIATTLVYGEKDGYRTVSQATSFCRDNKIAEGAAYVADLRKRPRAGLSPVEIQAEDMAEFALYRTDASKKETCIELLKKVHAAGPTTIWGWAAAGFLEDFGALASVKLPERDSTRSLGEIAVGVLDFQPKRLEASRTGSGDARAAMKRLQPLAAERLPKKLPDPEQLKAGTEPRRALLRTHLLELCGEKAVLDVLAKQGGEALFARLWKDERTLEAFLLSGPVFDPPRALEALMTFYLNDENDWASTEEGRKITVAFALNVRPLGKKDNPEAILLNRLRCYAAYRRLSQRKLFHESTAKRDAREWRFIVRDPTSPEDVLYLNSRPFNYARPGSMIHTVPYRMRNCFGEIIFRHDAYYRPWRLSDWPYWYKVHRVGGVCNRQSTYGAVSANAHGLMAERAGQPNHCAWLLRSEEGVWNIRNDINKYTAGVFMFWGRGYQYIQATERAFASRAAWDRSELYRYFAHHETAEKRIERAEAALHKSISACPYNLSAWRDFTELLKGRKADAKAWRQYLAVLLKSTPEGRTATWDLAFEALNELRKAGVADAELLEDVLNVVRALPEPAKGIPEEMNYEGVALKRAVGLFPKDATAKLKILATALDANWGTKHYFSQVLRQGIEIFSKDAASSEKFFAAFAIIAKRHAKEGGELSGKGINFRALIETASVTHQREAFQTLGELRNRLEPPPQGTPYPGNDFDGRLISAKGLLYTSGRVKGDAPQDYPRVIDASPLKPKRPYQIAMKPPEDPWAVVQLPGDCKLSGVVVTGEKMERLTVSVSEDGKQWKTLFTDEGGAKTEIRADFRTQRPQAKYVRIGRVKNVSTEPLRIAKILVYGATLY